MEEQIFNERTNLENLNQAVDALKEEVAKVIIGQENMVELLLVAILADGHVLIEGVPGVAKTLTARLLSKAVDVGFSRIQFTPDLMPSDVLGTSIFHPQQASFQFRNGPVFSNLVLIDEINRAPAKTQAALFEVMEEKQVTVDGHTYSMEAPFMVVATQNPVEQEGTYHLPEAQLDRFLFKINVGYPNTEQEVAILRLHHGQGNDNLLTGINAVMGKDLLLALRKQVKLIHVEEKLLGFIAALVAETRNHKHIYLGASPRASIGIMNASKAYAAISGRDFVTPEDIVFVTAPVLRHRIIITPEKEMEGGTPDEVIQEIIQSIEVPR
ncbi:MoxR family ATPase [Flavihumibacter sp. CACIAM 22H1]|uniref:AAA family ATPase n=1 Tax=Flavihumibacter sp. CACIAM 22H1 TaxID=1812911 RepID=UPI0007A8B50E|nr:MoxR family ATPase [Flavihumibacter sp. CACIAM 22H1]KYP15025.1 MAG: magnesium chelatase [Flavihumibacter sp. CACIAM 22H1]